MQNINNYNRRQGFNRSQLITGNGSGPS